MFCTEKDIYDAFSPFGHVQEVKIMKNMETHRNLSYGFVTFANMEDAERAKERLNGTVLCGRPMRYLPSDF